MKTRWAVAASSVVAVAVVATMAIDHRNDVASQKPSRADMVAPQALPTDQAILRQLTDSKVQVSGLSVRSAGDIVLLRGTGDAASAEAAVSIVKSLGVRRVANLITPANVTDDDAIRRSAERELAASRTFDGCKLRVSCDRGVVRISGTVNHELQKDAARTALRTVNGVRAVELDLAIASASM